MSKTCIQTLMPRTRCWPTSARRRHIYFTPALTPREGSGVFRVTCARDEGARPTWPERLQH
jgi:hypothetical protein